MGNVLKDQGNLDEAVKAYNRAIDLKPNFAASYNNLGNALKDQGKLYQALETYDKAISLKSNYAEAYNNKGIALQDNGMLAGAVKAYKTAIEINVDYAEAYWNLSGTTNRVSEAKFWVKKCLNANPNYSIAKLSLTALEFYEGDKSGYNALLKSTSKNDPKTRSFTWVFNLPILPPLYFNRWALFDKMVELSKERDHSTNLVCGEVKRLDI